MFNKIFSNFIRYFYFLKILNISIHLIIGVSILITMFLQVFSGFILVISLTNNSIEVVFSRNVEDIVGLYIDDFFWLHDRGVDYLFLLVNIHLLKKFKDGNYLNSSAWYFGVITFIILYLVILLLLLCCTHFSEITLLITVI